MKLRRTPIVATAALIALTLPATAADTPVLSGTFLDAADDNRFFTRLGGSAKDVIAYEGLTPGTPYVIESRMTDTANPDATGEPVVVEFTPESASGEVIVEHLVPANEGEVNIDYVTQTVLKSGGEEVAVLEGDARDPLRTIQVHSIQRLGIESVADAADGDLRIDGQGGDVKVMVSYANLVEGYPYTVWGQLLSQSGQAIGVFASIPEYAPEGKAGEVELTFTVPAGFEGISVVPSVGIYHKKRVEVRDDGGLVWNEGAANPVMIASDTDLDDPERTVEIGVPFGQTE